MPPHQWLDLGELRVISRIKAVRPDQTLPMPFQRPGSIIAGAYAVMMHMGEE